MLGPIPMIKDNPRLFAKIERVRSEWHRLYGGVLGAPGDWLYDPNDGVYAAVYTVNEGKHIQTHSVAIIPADEVNNA